MSSITKTTKQTSLTLLHTSSLSSPLDPLGDYSTSPPSEYPAVYGRFSICIKAYSLSLLSSQID